MIFRDKIRLAQMKPETAMSSFHQIFNSMNPNLFGGKQGVTQGLAFTETYVGGSGNDQREYYSGTEIPVQQPSLEADKTEKMRKILQKCHLKFMSNLTKPNTRELVGFLFSEGIITPAEKETLSDIHGCRDLIEKMLDYLSKK